MTTKLKDTHLCIYGKAYHVPLLIENYEHHFRVMKYNYCWNTAFSLFSCSPIFLL